MEEQNSNPQEDQTSTQNDEGIFNENVRSTARGEHKAADIVSHLQSYENYCHTDLMKAAFHAVLDDFKTKAYLDDYGKRMKYLDKLHEVAKEVEIAKAIRSYCTSVLQGDGDSSHSPPCGCGGKTEAYVYLYSGAIQEGLPCG